MYVSKMSLLLAESDTVALLEQFDLAGRTAQHRPFDGSGNSGVVTTIDCSNDIENGTHYRSYDLEACREASVAAKRVRSGNTGR